MTPRIALLASLDTKGKESEFLKSCLEKHGAEAFLIDTGYGGSATISADFDAAAVASAAGSSIEQVHDMTDTGEASQVMIQGSISILLKLIAENRCDGVIAFGGASNTTLSTTVMNALPCGIPKLMISSAAAMPAYAARYFGSKDIVIMHSIVDLSGLNSLTRTFLEQGAAAVCGMATCNGYQSLLDTNRKLIAVTTFRFAEACSQMVILQLEEAGYAAIPFHAQGVGENCMEDIVAQGVFSGVVDIVPAGLGEAILGGNRAARLDRLEAAGKSGTPHVIAPSGFDMLSCGPIERRDQNDKLWEKLGISERKLSIPDRYRVEARTSAEEVAAIGTGVAKKLNQATGPVKVLVPSRGWSSLSVEGADLYDPLADSEFTKVLRQSLSTEVALLEFDAELNSEVFANALVTEITQMVETN